MITQFSRVRVNSVPVNNPDAVERVLAEYQSCPRLKVTGGPREVLTMDDDGSGWPSAVTRATIRAHRGTDEGGPTTHGKFGQEGFSDLLLALAPYLVAPLRVQAASFTSAGEFEEAKEWTVWPGASAVEVKEIIPFGGE